ncbi:right-handed parallel beta-helix repeat-containing protein [Lentzea sp. JNUCC 0626]|uniref:right-handed parallel beta-helix repeat-containing protein n=1 Tax=Lentzea sp. JNUCC 0626 TaxID=3367513 RepID=UPI003747C26D
MRKDLRALLRSAHHGDVIELPPGRYEGEFVVDSRIELRAQDGPGTVTLFCATGTTLMLLAEATVRDLTIIGNAWGHAAVEVSGPVRPKIDNCVLSAPGHTAVRARGGARPEVLECRIGPAAHGVRGEAGGEFWQCEFTDVALASVVAAFGAHFDVANSRFVRQGGHAVVVEKGAMLSLRDNDFECGPVTAISSSGRLDLSDCTVHGGDGTALEIEDGLLRADRVRVDGVGGEGVLVSGGEGLLRSCRFTGTHGPAVWMMGGRARFERCEAIDSDRDGFLVVAGKAEFDRCVAHNNAGKGFSLLQKVSLDSCESYGNGVRDDLSRPAAVSLSPDGEVLRLVGPDGYRSVQEAVSAAAPGEVVEIEPGRYPENVRVDVAIELRAMAQSGSAALAATEKYVLSLTGDATLRGLALSGDVWVSSGTSVTFENCDLTDGTLHSGPGSALVFRDCRLSSEVIAGGALTMNHCTMTGAHGVRVAHEDSVATIHDCRFVDVEKAIVLARGRSDIAEVSVHGGCGALEVYEGVHEISRLTVDGVTGTGIEIFHGTGTFTDCAVTGAGGPGVMVMGGTMTFERCQTLNGTLAGFELAGGTSTLTRCVAKDNAREGFVQYGETPATLVECESTGNGRADLPPLSA